MMNNLPIIIVTGANGQLGKSLKQISEEYPHFQFFFTDIEDMDITKDGCITAFFNQKGIQIDQFAENPFILINAAAYTNVDKAEDDIELCDEINHLSAARLARECRKIGGMMIQISTDYVFDGKKSSPYLEDDIPTPLSIYGRSKLSGEEAVINILDNRAIVVRTSWLYHDGCNNFVNKMIYLSAQRDTLSVVMDQVGTPTYALHLALALMSVAMDGFSHEHFPFSIVHYTDEGVCSWYDLAYLAVRQKGNSDCIIKPIISSEFPMKAQRPNYSVLSKRRFDSYYQLKRYHWSEGVEKFNI